MTQLQQLLSYQKADKNLYEIEKKISTSDERKNYVKVNNYLKSAMEKLDQLDAKAGEMSKLIKVLEEKYAHLTESIAELANVDEHISQGGDLSFYRRNADALLNKIKAIKKDIENLCNKINEYDKEYQDLKKDVIKAQKLHKKYKEEYDTLKANNADAMKEIKKELDKLSAEIDADLLAKYSAKRAEKVAMPILYPHADGRCLCGTEVNASDKIKLSKGELVECESCRRLLFENK